MADDDDNATGSLSQNGSQHEQDKSPEVENQYSTFDHWVLLHFFTFFSVSFLLGLVIIHSSLLWHRYQSSNDDILTTLMPFYYGYGEDSTSATQKSYDTLVNISMAAL